MWVGFGPWVTGERVTHQLFLAVQTQGLTSVGESPLPQSGCQTDRQELPPCLIVSLPPGIHKWNVYPRNPVRPQQHWHQPRTIHQSVSSPKSPFFFSLSGEPVSQSQTFTVHTCLPQKYQCICCQGGVPKTSCIIHTNHSFFYVCVSFTFFV